MTRALRVPGPFWLAIVAALLVAPALLSARQDVSESSLKAAFLYNFAKFTDWPADAVPAAAVIHLCVTGSSVADALRTLTAGRTIDGHPLAVKRVNLNDPITACELLHADGLDARKASALIAVLRGASVLSVSDLDEFPKMGGVARLFLDKGQMRFAINIDAAGRARLHMSAQLLTLATIVKDGHP